MGNSDFGDAFLVVIYGLATCEGESRCEKIMRFSFLRTTVQNSGDVTYEEYSTMIGRGENCR